MKFLCMILVACNLMQCGSSFSRTRPLGSVYQFFEDDEAWADAQYLDPENYKPGEFEWWYVDGHLSDGFVFATSFFIRIQENGNMVTSIKLNLTKDGEVLRDDEILVDSATASFSKEKCDVRIGKSFIRSLDGLRTFEIYIDDEQGKGVSLDLTLEKTVPTFTAMPKFLKIKKDYFDWMCTAPNGDITGTITVGDKTTEVRGSGYHDHNWGDVPLSDLLNGWLWSRGEVDGFTTVAASLHYKNGITVTLVFVAKGKKVYVAAVGPGVCVQELRHETNPNTGNEQTVDCKYSFVTLKGIGSVTFKSKEQIASYAHMSNGEQHGWYTRYSALNSIKMGIQGISTGEGYATFEVMDLD